MSQKNVVLTSTPQAVAIGPGNAMLQASEGVTYFIGTALPSSDVPGFNVNPLQREPMELGDGEILYISGTGNATVYAELDPA